MIQQALLRTLTLALGTTILFTGGCKDTSGAGSGVPGSQAEPAGTVGGGGGGAQTPAPETTPETAPVTATAGETAGPTEQPPGDSTEVFVECTTRSSICTREYSPVCGKLTDGARKTYSNKCVACGDHAVVGYSPRACPEPT